MDRSTLPAPLKFLMLIALALAAALIGCNKKEESRTDSQAAQPAKDSAAAKEIHSGPAWHTPQACAQCHQAEFEAWKTSHHAIAQRGILSELDDDAFSAGKTVDETGQTYLLRKGENGARSIEAVYTEPPGETDRSKAPRSHAVSGVIGEDPIRQFLVDFPGGRKQVHAMTWDPHNKEWFNVFGGEERLPGDWGHWTEQGMNWNSNCASCHMTEYKKNFDPRDNVYRSAWRHEAIGCIQCHRGMEEHVDEARSGSYKPKTTAPSPAVAMDNCASCHSRREELTDNGFAAGESYHDHFRLTLADQPGAYFPGGQANEENYVYGSLMMSRMGEKGVTCLDCHDPHSHRTKLPVENNALCMSCHATGEREAIKIDPIAHSHHPVGSTGFQCVSCHMPERVYMERDARRDHGFTIPDPQLSIEFGQPNACSECHKDQTDAWALDHFTAWYGESELTKKHRQRARALDKSARNDPAAFEEIMALHGPETNAYWRTAYMRILGYNAGDPEVLAKALKASRAESPAERDAAIRVLANRPDRQADVTAALADSSRIVRLQAADALMAQFDSSNRAFQEWVAYADANADRPSGALRRAELAVAQGDHAYVKQLARQATEMDANNPHLLYDAAILLDRIGDVNTALQNLAKAKLLDPELASIYYAEGLLKAEIGDQTGMIASLQTAVSKDPTQHRWWYNLSVAQMQSGDLDAARTSAMKTLELQPTVPDYIQLIQYIEAQAARGRAE